MATEKIIINNGWRKQVGEYHRGKIKINCSVIWRAYSCKYPSDFIFLFTQSVVHEWVHYFESRFGRMNYYYNKNNKCSDWIEYITELMSGEQ